MTTISLNDLSERAKSDPRAEVRLFDTLFATFTRLIKYHYKQYRIDAYAAEDIASKAIRTVWERYRTATMHKGFEAWARVVLRNKIMNYLTQAEGYGEKLEHIQSRGPVHPGYEPAPGFWIALRDCLTEMAESNRPAARVLNLQLDELDKTEICKLLDIAGRTFDATASIARRLLRNCLRGKGAL